MNGCSFQQVLREIWIGFCINTWKRFFLEVLFKANRKSIGSSKKNDTKDFQNSPPFERPARFHVALSRNFKRFQYFNFVTGFLENENLFQKIRVKFFS